MFLIEDPAIHYRRFFDKLRTEVIDGNRVFSNLEEWYAYPYKYDAMGQLSEFKNMFYKRAGSWWSHFYLHPYP
ncbi:hypothetical protein K7432_013401 [Basidiobolus ranarum]|uniref:Uncharacterized protein n=1 Tax=Basidiobolus ranarum TaxID=34480 RepID=A0ABR2WJA2_9FUNG